MDVKKLFNILLLALSLSTIFITLISYIIFKLRQAASNSLSKDVHELEGTYFRRYAPELDKLNQEKREEEERKSSSPRRKILKFVSVASFIFFTVFTILFFEDHFKYRKQLEKRVTSAAEFKELVLKGLFKKYTFSPLQSELKIVESPSKPSEVQFKLLQANLQSHQFCLYNSWRSSKFFPLHEKSKESWKEFFNRNNLKFQQTNSLNSKKDCTWILPHVKSLSGREREALAKIIKLRNVIVVGSLGFLNGLGNTSDQDLLREIFKVKFVSENGVTPTLFNHNSLMSLEIPSGRQLEWYPQDKDLNHIETESIPSLVVASFDGSPIFNTDKLPVLNKSRLYYNGKTSWIALDPIDKDGIDQRYSDHILLGLLSKDNSPLVKVSNFKTSDKSISFVLSRDSSDIKIIDMVEAFAGVAPFTSTFSKSDYEKLLDEDLLENVKEVGLNGKFSEKIENLTTKEIFNKFQTSRFDLEELSHESVKGYFPENEVIVEKALTSAELNNLNYVFGGQYINSYGPIRLKDSDMFYYPRLFLSGSNLLQDKLLVTLDDFLNKLESQYQLSQFLDIQYVFQFTNSEFHSPIFREAVEKFLKKYAAKVNILGENIEWLKLKEELVLRVYEFKNTWYINIQNPLAVETGEFSIDVSHKGALKKIPIRSIKPYEQYSFKID